MVPVPTVGHPFDDVVAMFGDIHFDPAAYAHAPRPFRCVVDKSQRFLEPVHARVGPTLDQESLLFHALPVMGFGRSPVQVLTPDRGHRFQRLQTIHVVRNQVSHRVALLEPQHRPDLIDIAASLGQSFCNRSPRAQRRHALESGPAKAAVDVKDDAAQVVFPVADGSDPDRILVPVFRSETACCPGQALGTSSTPCALPAPDPFFQIGVHRRNDLCAGEEEWPLFAVDGGMGAHHRFFAYRPVFGQVVPHFEPRDFQGLGRGREQYQQHGHIPFPQWLCCRVIATACSMSSVVNARGPLPALTSVAAVVLERFKVVVLSRPHPFDRWLFVLVHPFHPDDRL